MGSIKRTSSSALWCSALWCSAQCSSACCLPHALRSLRWRVPGLTSPLSSPLSLSQPFEDVLEGTPYAYSSFSIRLTKEDIPNLPSILRAVPTETLCALQAMLARVYRAFLWQQTQGPQHASAYDLTQILLCRRAKALAARYARSGRHPRAFLARNAQLRCADSLDAANIRF